MKKIKMLDGLSGNDISITAGDELAVGSKKSQVSEVEALRWCARGIAEPASKEMETLISAKAKEEADAKAKEEAEVKAKEEADAKAKEEADAKAKEKAPKKTK